MVVSPARGEVPLLPGVVTALLVGLVYAVIASNGTFRFEQSLFPHHVLIADGWLHGQLSARDDVLHQRSEAFVASVRSALEQALASQGGVLAESDWQRLRTMFPALPVMQDWSVVGGKYYGYFGPMPALLLLPYVALAGPDASDMLVSCLCGTVTVFLMFLALRQAHRRGLIEATTPLCVAVSLLLGLGTVQFFLSVSGQVWFVSQVMTACFLSLAIYCLLRTSAGVGWPAAAGAAFGAALLTRTSILPTILFFYLVLPTLSRPSADARRRQLLRHAIAFSMPVLAAAALSAAFNYARFGSLLETGLRIQVLTDASPIFKERYLHHGIFSIYYLPGNLYYYFINPRLLRESATHALTFDGQGNSMFLVTPALLYVFRAYRRGDRFVRALWLGVGGSLMTLLLFFGTGDAQFGNRYLLDLLPLAMLLIAIGMRGRLSWVGAALIGLSIAANTWGTYRFCIERGNRGWVSQYVTASQVYYGEIHRRLANVQKTRGNVPEAIAHYTEALRWRPDFAGAHVELANLLREQGRCDEAIAQYEATLRLNPADGKAHNSLGLTLAEQGSLDAAIGHFEQAVRLDADDVEARNNLTNALQARDRRIEAAGHDQMRGGPVR